MKRIRIGNNIAIEWLLYENDGNIHNLEGKDLELYMTCGGLKFVVPDYTVTENAIAWTFPAQTQTRTGYYKLVLVERNEQMGLKSYDVREAFCLEPEDALENIETIVNGSCTVKVKSVLTYAHITNVASVNSIEASDGKSTTITVTLTNGKTFTLPFAVGSESYQDINVIDALNSRSVDDALSANQGRVLKGMIDNIPNVTVLDRLDSTDKNAALSANMGKRLKDLIDSIDTSGGGSGGGGGSVDIVDNLLDGGRTKALSAEQGKILKGLIDAIDGSGSGGGGGGGGSTSDIGVNTMYSAVSEPGTPATDSGNWHPGKGSGDIWLAIQFKENGVWGPWVVISIGEYDAVYASFKSFVFKRSNSTISSAPTGGSYSDPYPTDTSWTDGIPAGTGAIWMSSRKFTSDDNAHGDSNWSTPRKIADNEYWDYEFSSVENQPGTPSKASPTSTQTNPNWSDTADETTWWMAMRKIDNDVYSGDWMVVKIKGERGQDGTSLTPLGSIFGVYDSVSAAQTAYNADSSLKATDYAICKDSGSSVYDKLYKFVRTGVGTSTNTDMTSNVETGDFYLDSSGNMWIWDGDNFINAGTLQGAPGQDGDTPYIHIKYSNDGGTSFTGSDGEEPGDYIGIYWDYVATDSTNPNSYSWKYWKGEDGFGYEYVFKTTSTQSAPSIPSVSDDEDDYIPDGWTDDPGIDDPDYRYCWVAWRKKEDGEWSAWHGDSNDKARLFCFVGEDGANGYNTAVVYLYKRATTTPSIDWASNLTYTFSSHSLSSTPAGWSQVIPANNGNPLYVTAATAASREATDVIGPSEWASPVELAEDGLDGLNSATVRLFKRAATTPTVPSGTLTYTFATGALSGTLSGWTQAMPATDGNPCWCIQATAISTEATDSILSSEWSSPENILHDGQDGTSAIFPFVGEFTTAGTYYGSAARTDIVKYLGNYYIAKADAPTGSDGTFSGSASGAIPGTTNSSYWTKMNSYSNVATDTLFAEDANVANFLFHNGVLESAYTDSSNNPTLTLDGVDGEIIAKKGKIGELDVTSSGLSADYEEIISTSTNAKRASTLTIDEDEFEITNWYGPSTSHLEGEFSIATNSGSRDGFVEIKGVKTGAYSGTNGGFDSTLYVSSNSDSVPAINAVGDVIVNGTLYSERVPVVSSRSSTSQTLGLGDSGTLVYAASDTAITWSTGSFDSDDIGYHFKVVALTTGSTISLGHNAIWRSVVGGTSSSRTSGTFSLTAIGVYEFIYVGTTNNYQEILALYYQ